MNSLLESWRWYGPNDVVTLDDIQQAGARVIVSALHHIPVGEIWPTEEIKKRKSIIEWDQERSQKRNLIWAVVESVNVSEAIKTGLPERDKHIDNYITTLQNLAACGIHTVCYNFMPVLDWVRTDLDFQLANHAEALRFDYVNIALFDIHILQRENATKDYPDAIVSQAQERFSKITKTEKNQIQRNILAGLPGTTDVIELDYFKKQLSQYAHITREKLKENYVYFLERVIPEAEKINVKLCVHPDDPPYPIFGLPRIVSSESDLKFLTEAVDSPSNGITFCTGSLGPNSTNDLVGIIKRLGHKFYFVHLRNIQREYDGSFYESDHLDGSVDMYGVMKALIQEVTSRDKQAGPLPFRPDHGHRMLDDLKKTIPFSGYSAIGRLKGLAELRGLQLAILKNQHESH